jgi:hypothetical protein
VVKERTSPELSHSSPISFLGTLTLICRLSDNSLFICLFCPRCKPFIALTIADELKNTAPTINQIPPTACCIAPLRIFIIKAKKQGKDIKKSKYFMLNTISFMLIISFPRLRLGTIASTSLGPLDLSLTFYLHLPFLLRHLIQNPIHIAMTAIRPKVFGEVDAFIDDDFVGHFGAMH